MKVQEVVKELKKYYNPKNITGMARFGITGKNVLGGPGLPILRQLAKKIKKEDKNSHELAQKLWVTEIHEARILAAFVDEATLVNEKQMDSWVKDFDSWDICDEVCLHLFDRTKFAYKKCFAWAKNEKEFVRRAGFALMAVLAVHDKQRKDNDFLKFFSLVKKYSVDERNFVKKAVSWSLRQIGKRNFALRKEALKLATELKGSKNKTTRWIGSDVYRELIIYKF